MQNLIESYLVVQELFTFLLTGSGRIHPLWALQFMPKVMISPTYKRSHFVGIVLLDLQKAFDTVDNGILLMKLKALSLSQDVSRWFWSYLCDLQQLVDVSGTLSSHACVSCDVPQESILEPLLFFYICQ